MKQLLAKLAKKITYFAGTKYKQVILVREDLKLPKGKMAAQAAHASVDAVLKAEDETVKEWRKEGMKKIVLKVKDEKELYSYVQQAKDYGLTTAVISDAGHTIVEPGTVTCAAIGPNGERDVDKITGHLPTM
ncbi:peptidyl-tRNA hydrolase Pth2 [Candidatus Woesearchaeota archaeon]|nr:peptidyl-tRNA hydrolase Pth2 [Candidatus Woesearchaeota archaeon]